MLTGITELGTRGSALIADSMLRGIIHMLRQEKPFVTALIQLLGNAKVANEGVSTFHKTILSSLLLFQIFQVLQQRWQNQDSSFRG